jgi:hypothetical protein
VIEGRPRNLIWHYWQTTRARIPQMTNPVLKPMS